MKNVLLASGFVVITVVCLVAFHNALHNSFTFDDNLALVNNGDVSNINSNLWENDLWGKNIRAHDSHKSYRPLLILLFKSIYHRVSKEPWAFRIVSIVSHVTSSLLVLTLSQEFFSNFAISFPAALFFAAHPIHVEAVSAIVNTAEGVSTILLILLYTIYIKSLKAKKLSLLGTLTWIGCVVVSILFKETGLIGCAIIIAKSITELVLFVFKSLAGTEKNQDKLKSVAIHIYWDILSCLMCYLYFSFRSLLINGDIRIWQTSIVNIAKELLISPIINHSKPSDSYLGSSQLIRKAENPFSFLSGEEKIRSYLYLHFRYMYQLLYPITQSPEYSYECISKISTSDDIRNWYWIAMYSILLGLIVWGIYMSVFGKDSDSGDNDSSDSSSNDSDGNNTSSYNVGYQNDNSDSSSATAVNQDTNKHSSNSNDTNKESNSNGSIYAYNKDGFLHALLWLVVSFFPYTGIPFKLGTLLAERLLYVPSIGYCMIQAFVLFHVMRVLVEGVCYCLLGSVVNGDNSKLGSNDNDDAVNSSSDNNSSEPELTSTNEQSRRKPKKPSNVLTTSQIIFLFLYSIIVTIITILYILRTREYNTTWKDDNTLFLRSIDVCPRSAKMHIQVSKIYSNSGNYTQARYHVNMAKSIDPEFCDVGYQEALLSIAIDNDSDEAIEHALENLKCIFSNSQSMQLINQVWGLEVSQATQYRPQSLHEVLSKQADLSAKYGLDLLAAKKYIDASVSAFDHNYYEQALLLTYEAEKILMKVDKLNQEHIVNHTESEIIPIPNELKCRIYLLSGTTRAYVMNEIETQNKTIATNDDTNINSDKSNNKKKNKKQNKQERSTSNFGYSKKAMKQLTRTKELLFQSIEPMCVPSLSHHYDYGKNIQSVADIDTVMATINNQINIGLSYLNVLVSKEVELHSNDPVMLQDYARLATRTYYITIHNYYIKQQLTNIINQRINTVNNNGDNNNIVVNPLSSLSVYPISPSMYDLRNNTARTWNIAGVTYHNQKKFNESKICFQQTLLLYSPIYDTITTPVGAIKHYSIEELVQAIRRMDISEIGCNAMYWYSDAMAGSHGFQQDIQQITLLHTLLTQYITYCPNSVTKNKLRETKEELDEILQQYHHNKNKHNKPQQQQQQQQQLKMNKSNKNSMNGNADKSKNKKEKNEL